MFDRRGFLKGLLISTSAAASTALVKLASPAETQALVLNRSVTIRQPPSFEPPHAMFLGAPVYVQREGDYLPIGILDSCRINVGVEEISTFHGDLILMPGLWSGHATFSSSL